VAEAEPGLADAVAAVAAEAGAHALGEWRTDFKRWEKEPGSPVCEIDLSVNALLRERLSALLPDAGWLSEETADDAARLNKRRCWVVDPIDGTRDYIRGRDGWAISIALVDGEQPVIGVLDATARGQVWRAEAGKGATLNGIAIAHSGRASFAGARTPADTLPKADRDLVAAPKPNSIALRIAMVAAGDADLLATLRWGHEWDIAAAVLIAREAGCATTDALGRKLRFNTPRAEAFGVMVTAPAIQLAALARLHDRAVEALGKPR